MKIVNIKKFIIGLVMTAAVVSGVSCSPRSKAMEALEKGASFEEVADIAANELQFLDSSNISKEYRQDLARVYVRRGLEEVSK